MAVGYGEDVWCSDSYQSGRIANARQVIAQAIYRRFITPRGTLRGGDEEQSYGLDVAGFIGRVGYPSALAALPALMRAEALKDDRVADCDVKVTQTRDTNGLIAMRIDATVEPIDDLESFTLTLGATDLTLSIIGGMP